MTTQVNASHVKLCTCHCLSHTPVVCYCAQSKPTVGEEEGGREGDGKREGKEKKMGGEVSAEMNVMCDRVPYIILT